jgi:threonine/homoserine/homoserine lactone efflux protein
VGIKTYFNITSTAISGLQKYEHVGNFASTFLLTMTNPVQIITLPLVFVAIGTGVRAENYGDALFFLAGLAVGAILLWTLFISIAASLKKRILEHHLHYINKFSGILITGTGIYIFLSLILR